MRNIIFAKEQEIEALKQHNAAAERPDSKEQSKRLAQRDIRVLDSVSGSGLHGWLRPDVNFTDGSSFNIFNHRALMFGSVVASWGTNEEVEITKHDTLRGIDPYQLTNLTLGSQVWGHPN